MGRRRAVTIRRSLVIGVLALVLALSGAIMATTFVVGGKLVENLAVELMREATRLVDAKLGRFVDPAAQGLEILAEWGEKGLLDTHDPERIRLQLWPYLDRFPQLAGVVVADEGGEHFALIRDGARWHVHRTVGGKVTEQVYDDIDGGKPVSERVVTDFDPRTRPWFEQGLKSDAIRWTDVYEFYTSGEPGVTATRGFSHGGRRSLVGFDVLLRDVQDFASDLHVQGRGRIAILGAGDVVVGLPRDPRFGRRADILLPRPEQLATPLLRDAIRRLPDAEPGRFESGGETWWGLRHRFNDHGADTTVVVLVPEDSLVHASGTRRVIVVAITAVVLAFGLWRVHVFAGRFARPIEALANEFTRMGRGDLEPGPPIEARVKEIRQLARAQDRAREALQTVMRMEDDLKIARRIQQDTWPKTLPILPGYSIAGWSEPADETGGDSYDVFGIRADGDVTDGPAEHGAFLVADATGHGIGPALSAAQVRAMARMAVRGRLSPVDALRTMNRHLCDDLTQGRFVTLWVGILDVAAHRFVSYSAGQGPLLRYVAARDAIEWQQPDTPPLGILPTLDLAPKEPLAFERGDVFVVFTDGIYEAVAPDGERFGDERVAAVVRANRDKTAREILDAVRGAVDAFTRGEHATDDRTGIVVKRD